MSSTRSRVQPIPWHFSARSVELGGGVLNGLDDVLVARAAAEVTGNAEADLLFAGTGVLLQQPVGAHDHTGCTEAALQAVHLAEAFLQSMQCAVGVGHAFDGADVGAGRLHREHGARLHRSAVEVDGAGSAMAGVAADMRAGEIELLSQEVD